jgi:hypothetical protein
VSRRLVRIWLAVVSAALLFAVPSYTQDDVPVGRSGVPWGELSPDTGENALQRPDRREHRPKEEEDEGDQIVASYNEPAVAVDPNNPLHVAVAGAIQLRVSIDGGLTFSPYVFSPLLPGYGRCGDSSLAYDSQGRLFWTYIICTATTLHLALAQIDPTDAHVIPGYPIDIGAALGFTINANNDKPWIAIDTNPASAFRDRLYVTWGEVPFSSRVEVTYSKDLGHTWNGLTQLSTPTEGFAWPPHITVGPNGDVYISYHAPRSTGTAGAVYLCRSTNGGVTFPQKTIPFPAGKADVTFNVQSVVATSIPKTNFWLQGNAQAYVMADPNVAGRIYVVASDDPDNNLNAGDASNVYLAASNDYGATFGAPVRIDDGPGTTFQVMPTAAIDPHSGAMLVHWYDNRSGALNPQGNYLLDLYARWSTDGGVTWSPSRKINDAPFDPDKNAPCRVDCNSNNPTLRIGEYNGAGIAGEAGFGAWTGNDPNGYQFIFFDRFTFDLFPPSITRCPPDTTVECAQSCGTPSVALSTWLSEFSATDSFDPSLTLANDAPVCFPMGETTVTFTATDDAGHTATCSAVVRVEDTTAPVIYVTLDRDVLWPPNHTMVEVCDTVAVHDACDTAPVITLVSIVSSEPDNAKGSGDMSPDIEDARIGAYDRCITLRSERVGTGDGRKYTIVYSATDDAGNTAYDTVCVRVPHDRAAVALAGAGFSADGAALLDNASRFSVIIPSQPGVDASLLDVSEVYLGNTRRVVRPVEHRVIDADGDGARDRVFVFPAEGVAAATADAILAGTDVDSAERSRETDGPVGIHFVSNGEDYLVANIFALGLPVATSSQPGAQSPAPVPAPIASTAISSVSPNPFNPETVVAFSLATGERVRITIFDVHGACVRRLVDQLMPAGAHYARWDGTDDRGGSSGSGIYFVRMTAGSYRETRKIVMLK